MKKFLAIYVVALFCLSGHTSEKAWMIPSVAVQKASVPTNAWLIQAAATEEFQTLPKNKLWTVEEKLPEWVHPVAPVKKQSQPAKFTVTIPAEACFTIDDGKTFCQSTTITTPELEEYGGYYFYTLRAFTCVNGNCKVEVKKINVKPGEILAVALLDGVMGQNLVTTPNTFQTPPPVLIQQQTRFPTPIRNFISNCKNGKCGVQ